jgi:hypothetical protein
MKEVKLNDKELATRPENALNTSSDKVVLRVGDHDVTLFEFKVFELYAKKYSYQKVADTLGVTRDWVFKLTKKDWFAELAKVYITERQHKLHAYLADHVDTLGEAIISIWDGTLENPKLANAIIKSAEVFGKMGGSRGKSYIEPLIQSKREFFVDNSVHTENTYNIDMNLLFPHMSMVELDQFSKDGKVTDQMIDKYKRISSGKIVEGEVVDVES